MNILKEIKNEKVEWKKLGEVCEVKNGYTPRKNNKTFWENGTIPWFKLEDIREKGHFLKEANNKVTELAIKKELFKANSIILATSATIGDKAIIEVPFICNQRFTVITPTDVLLPKYLYYYLDTLDNKFISMANNGIMNGITTEALIELKVPVIPLQIQNQVVLVLDKLRELSEETKGLLPKEIEQRQKQYEYYRNKLLTFNAEYDKHTHCL